MTSVAQKIISEGEFYSPIPQGPYCWLIKRVTDGAAVLWTYLLLQPPGFNHYPTTIASQLNTTVRTIQRRLNELLKCGALLKVTKKERGKFDVYYYRALPIPKDYRIEKEKDAPPPPLPTPPEPLPESPNITQTNRANSLDKSCKQIDQKITQTTNVSRLTRLSKKYSNNTYQSHTHSHSNRAAQNLSNGNGYGNSQTINYRKYFDQLINKYPAHKVPWHDPGYMDVCFKLFKHVMGRESEIYIEMATELCITDIEFRLQHCYHWLDHNDIPHLWAYLKHERWKLPVEFTRAQQDANREQYAGLGVPNYRNAPKRPQIAPVAGRIGGEFL